MKNMIKQFINMNSSLVKSERIKTIIHTEMMNLCKYENVKNYLEIYKNIYILQDRISKGNISPAKFRFRYDIQLITLEAMIGETL